MSALLSVENLTVEVLTRAGPRTVVRDLSFAIAPDEVLAIIGESGSGKSVATQAITGLLPSPPFRASGSVTFEGRELLGLPPADLRRLRGDRIGSIFQEPMSALNPMMPVGDQIAETLVTHRGIGWSAARAEAVSLLDRVRIPDAAARATLHPAALSGGMRQRVVIAAAIACRPALVIADEPTTALDATVQAEILGLLREMRAEVRCAVLFITHDMGVVRQIADRVLVMQRGAVIEAGSVNAVMQRPNAPYTKALIAAATTTSADGARPDEELAPPPALTIENLVVSFPGARRLKNAFRAERFYAVDGVSLTVGAGETVALVGESGSGKTTLARAVLGLAKPDSGAIRLRGGSEDTSPFGQRIQFVFQDPQSSINPRFRAWQVVTEPLLVRGDRQDLRARARPLLEQVGLDANHLDRLPHELSGGQRQRLGIARALAAEPDILIADEAVSALDATTKLQVLDLFARLQGTKKLPLLFITHDFSVVSRIAHRVAVMRFGRLLEIGPTAQVLASPRHAYTQALVAAARGEQVTLPKSAGHRVASAGERSIAPILERVSPGHLVEIVAQT